MAKKEDCLDCARYIRCIKSDKGVNFICKRFIPLLEIDDEPNEEESLVIKPTNLNKINFNKAESNLENMIVEGLGFSHLPKDLRVDDRDLPEYPNFYSFCISPQGLNLKPFPRQLAVATHLYGEWCPRCSHPDLKNISGFRVRIKLSKLMERLQLLENGVCPKCKVTKYELVKSKELNNYNELAACIGQRAGKSKLVAMLSTYHVHKYLKLQRPTEVLGLLSNETLTATFVALTYKTAVSLLWEPIYTTIQESKWFQEFHKVMQHYSNVYGEELFKVMPTFIHYRARSLMLYPSGPNKRTLRGLTRFIYSVDELGWFSAESNDAVKMNADEIYQALDRSLKTVRKSASVAFRNKGLNKILSAYAYNISSPSSYNDKIMNLIKVHHNSKKIYTVHLPTWEFNPKFKKTDFEEEYIANPVKAERDFGAIPPMASAPFLEDKEIIENMFQAGKRNRVKYEYLDFKNTQGFLYRSAIITGTTKQNQMPATMMGIDAGYNNNSFGIVIGHRNINKLDPRKVIIDAVVEISPEQGKVPLHHTRLVRHIIFELIKAFNVKALVSDRWQSLKIHTDVTEEFKKIHTLHYQVSKNDFMVFKSAAESHQISLPETEVKFADCLTYETNAYPGVFRYKPLSHLYLQCLTVNELPKTVTKGDGNLTDDLFRALVLTSVFVLDDEFAKRFLNSKVSNKGFGLGTVIPHSTSIGIQDYGIRGLSSKGIGAKNIDLTTPVDRLIFARNKE